PNSADTARAPRSSGAIHSVVITHAGQQSTERVDAEREAIAAEELEARRWRRVVELVHLTRSIGRLYAARCRQTRRRSPNGYVSGVRRENENRDGPGSQPALVSPVSWARTVLTVPTIIQ